MKWFKVGLLLNLAYSDLEDVLKTSISPDKYADKVLLQGLKDKTWSFLYKAMKHVYPDVAKGQCYYI